MNRSRRRAVACAAALALSVGGPFTSVSGAAGAAPDVPPATIARLAAIDCERVSAAQVREVLALVPAPRIVLLQGSVAVVTMEPFAQFLIGMGILKSACAIPQTAARHTIVLLTARHWQVRLHSTTSGPASSRC